MKNETTEYLSSLSREAQSHLLSIDDISIKTVYINISNGVGNHGSFLKHFGDAIVYSDIENYNLLKPTALALIAKYKLLKIKGL